MLVEHTHAQGHTLMETYTGAVGSLSQHLGSPPSSCQFKSLLNGENGNQTANLLVSGRPTLTTEPHPPYDRDTTTDVAFT